VRLAGGRRAAAIAGGLWLAAVALNLALFAAAFRAPTGTDDAGRGASPRVRTESLSVPEAPSPSPAGFAPETPGSAGTDAGDAASEAARLAVDAATLPMAVHTVGPGETLSVITLSYLGTGAAWKAVADHNGIAHPYVLRPGQEITLPMVRLARSRKTVMLSSPRLYACLSADMAGQAGTRADQEVYPSPPEAFGPLEQGLRLVHPFREAYPWRVPVTAAAGLIAALAAACVVSLSRAGGRVARRPAARTLGRGIAGAAGAAALVAGLAVAAAGPLSRSVALEVFLALVAGAASGGAGFACARPGTGGGDGTAGGRRRGEDLARAFGWASGLAVAAALFVAALSGWAAVALAAVGPSR